MKRHLLLIGLPGSGKSTVGKLVADQLGASFIEPDALIVRKMQMPIARVFGMHGEISFREMERQAVEAAVAGPPAVIAPGAGWAAQPGQLDQALSQAYVIYLKVMIGTAAKRVGDGESRPLLAGADPVEAIRGLLKDREEYYNRAEIEVKCDIKSAEQVAEEIVALARNNAGW